MLPLILGVLGGYLIGDSIKDGAISMAKGGKLKAQLIHKEHSVEYYKDGNLINPTKEEKLSWSIFGLPEGFEKKEQSFETVIDEFEGKTKKEIADKADTNTANGKYSYLPPMADTSLSFNDKYAKGGLTPTENLVKELNKLQRDLNSHRLSTYIEGDTSEESISLIKEREFKLARFNEVLELLRQSGTKLAEGGEVSKSWGVMLFKESKNRNGERIESAFNNLIMKGTLKQVIEDVKDELLGAITYATIKDRAGDVLVAKVKQDGTINIYREGYGFDKMAKGGETSFGDEYYIIVRTPQGLVTKKDFYGMGYNKKEIIEWCEERGWKYNEKGEKFGGQALAEYEFFLKKPTKYDIQLPKKYEGNMANGGKVSDVYIFDIYLYSYNDEGSIDGVKEKRKMSVKASSRANAYDKVKTKYPRPYFVELNRMGSD